MRANHRLLLLYRQALGMFPGGFRREFADEMIEVIRQAAEHAAAQGWPAWLVFWLREFIALPGCLAQQHWLALTQTEANMSAQPAFQGAGEQNPPAPALTPPSSFHLFLAALPHLLIGLLVSLGEGGFFQNPSFEIFSMTVPAVILLWLAVGGGLLWVLVSAWRSGWPGWSGAWLTYLGLAAFLGLVALISVLGDPDWLNRYNYFSLLIPAVVAYGLYRITRRNVMHGLLAGLTMVVIVGTPSLEFVPPVLKAGVTACGWLVLALTSMLALQAGGSASGSAPVLRRALPVALLGSILILLPFAWVGIYYGGMLNFDAPGPSWVQVLRSGFPYFNLAACLLLGPQLARLLRRLDLENNRGYLWRYRLALLGELFLLAGVVVIFWQYASSISYVQPIPWFGIGLLAAGLVISSVGTGLVVRSAGRQPSRWWAGRLYLALLGLPWSLLASLPSPLDNAAYTYRPFTLALTHYPEFGLHLSALLWAILTVWVILTGEQNFANRTAPGGMRS